MNPTYEWIIHSSINYYCLLLLIPHATKLHLGIWLSIDEWKSRHLWVLVRRTLKGTEQDTKCHDIEQQKRHAINWKKNFHSLPPKTRDTRVGNQRWAPKEKHISAFGFKASHLHPEKMSTRLQRGTRLRTLETVCFSAIICPSRLLSSNHRSRSCWTQLCSHCL